MADEPDGDRAQRVFHGGTTMGLVNLGHVYAELGRSLVAFGERAALTRRDECERFSARWRETAERALRVAKAHLRETVKRA